MEALRRREEELQFVARDKEVQVETVAAQVSQRQKVEKIHIKKTEIVWSIVQSVIRSQTGFQFPVPFERYIL